MAPYDCIFINGDSYSAANNDSKVYGEFIADHFGIPLHNYAVPGSSNDRILRTSIEYLELIKKEYQNPLVIVGWSFVSRVEIWEERDDLAILKKVLDQDLFPGTKFITLDYLLNSSAVTIEQKAIATYDAYHHHKQMMDFYTNLYLFSHLLEFLKFDYLFFSAADNRKFFASDYPSIEQYWQAKWVRQNQRIHDLSNFNVKHWANKHDPDCKTTGHLSQTGHKEFANVLLNIIEELA